MAEITSIACKEQKTDLYREADHLQALFEELEEVGRMVGRPNLTAKVYVGIMVMIQTAKMEAEKAVEARGSRHKTTAGCVQSGHRSKAGISKGLERAAEWLRDG